MKVASRFPIKTARILLTFLAVLHLFVMLLSGYWFGFSWQLMLVLFSLLFSSWIGWRHYQNITQAPDDLCWNGNHWLIKSNDKLNAIVYLTLLPQSWISEFACLLYFSSGQQQHIWFFTRYGLGNRAYRELCYLAKRDIRAQQSIQAKT